MQISGKSFKYKTASSKQMGFIAQELQQVVPEVVREDENGLSVDIVGLVPLLVEALKELHTITQYENKQQFQQLNRAVCYPQLKLLTL